MKVKDVYYLILTKDSQWTSFYVYLEESGTIGKKSGGPIPNNSSGVLNLKKWLATNPLIDQQNLPDGVEKDLFVNSKNSYKDWIDAGYNLYADIEWKNLNALPLLITREDVAEYLAKKYVKFVNLHDYVTTLETTKIKFKILNVPPSLNNQVLFKETSV